MSQVQAESHLRVPRQAPGAGFERRPNRTRAEPLIVYRRASLKLRQVFEQTSSLFSPSRGRWTAGCRRGQAPVQGHCFGFRLVIAPPRTARLTGGGQRDLGFSSAYPLRSFELMGFTGDRLPDPAEEHEPSVTRHAGCRIWSTTALWHYQGCCRFF